ncbi:hypothetical protein YN1_4840 [Nanoarchaeota archaeon]
MENIFPSGLDKILNSLIRFPDYIKFEYNLSEGKFKHEASYKLERRYNEDIKICYKSYVISDTKRKKVAFECIDNKSSYYYPELIEGRHMRIAEIDLSFISEENGIVILMEHKKGKKSNISILKQLVREVALTSAIFEGYSVIGYGYKGVFPYAFKSVAALNNGNVYYFVIYRIKPNYHPEKFSEMKVYEVKAYTKDFIEKIISNNRKKSEKLIEKYILD